MAKRKWEISGLKCNKQVKKASDLILKTRLDDLIGYVEEYFKLNSVENLHDVRIAFRRIRYTMESFLNCYDKKIFNKLYNQIQSLQDLSGSVRDVDISIESMQFLKTKFNVPLEDSVISKANEHKKDLEEKFKLELMKFYHGKPLKNFYEQIS